MRTFRRPWVDYQRVRVVDNLSTGRLANLNHLEREPRFRFIEQDITKPFDPGKVDFIFVRIKKSSPEI